MIKEICKPVGTAAQQIHSLLNVSHEIMEFVCSLVYFIYGMSRKHTNLVPHAPDNLFGLSDEYAFAVMSCLMHFCKEVLTQVRTVIGKNRIVVWNITDDSV